MEFAERHGMAGHVFEPQPAGVPSTGVKVFIDHAVAAVRAAGGTPATLQHSPMLLEVGDVELRKGLTEVRELIDEITPEPASWCVG